MCKCDSYIILWNKMGSCTSWLSPFSWVMIQGQWCEICSCCDGKACYQVWSLAEHLSKLIRLVTVQKIHSWKKGRDSGCSYWFKGLSGGVTSTRTRVRWSWAVCLKAGREISFQQQQACIETTALPILCIISVHIFLHVTALQDLLGTILKNCFIPLFFSSRHRCTVPSTVEGLRCSRRIMQTLKSTQ